MNGAPPDAPAVASRPKPAVRDGPVDAESEAMTEDRSTEEGENHARVAANNTVTVSAATSVPQQVIPEPRKPAAAGGVRKAAVSPSTRIRQFGSEIPPTTDAIKKGVPDALRTRKGNKGNLSARGPPPSHTDRSAASGFLTPKPKAVKVRSLTPGGRERKGLSHQPEEYKRRSQTPNAQTRGMSGVLGFLNPTQSFQNQQANQPGRVNSLTFRRPESPGVTVRKASRSGDRLGVPDSLRGTPATASTARQSPRSAATLPSHSKPVQAVQPPRLKRRGSGESGARTPPVSARSKQRRTPAGAPHSSLTSTFSRPVAGAAPSRSVSMTQVSPSPLGGLRRPKTKSLFPATLPLPPRHSKYNLTVIFDLDQTLVNAHNVDDTIVPRPDMLACLEEIGAYGVERIMWTASNEAQARFVMKKVPGLADLFDHVVTWDTQGWGDRRDYVKDIMVLGRPAASALLIDNDHLVVRPHVNNALIVDDYGDLKGGNIPDVCDVMPRLAMFIQCLTAMRPSIDVPAFIKAHGDWVEIKKKVGYYRLMITDEIIEFIPSSDNLVHHNYPNADGTYDVLPPPQHGELRVEYFRSLQECIPIDDTPIEREIHAPTPKKVAKRALHSMTFSAPVSKSKTTRGFQRTSTVKKRSDTPLVTRHHVA